MNGDNTYDVFMGRKADRDAITACCEELKSKGVWSSPRAVQLMNAAPAVLFSSIPLSRAQSFKEIAEKHGVSVTIKSSRKVPSPAPKPQAPPVARCPKCGSTSIQAVRKGFSFGKALVGTAVFGGVGAVAGLANDKYQRYCLNCGKKW